MNLGWASLIVVGVTAAAIASMLFVRSRAPEGSYFEDGDRAAGVFGVLATGLAVLLGFVVFLAFESLDTSRSGAKAEARVVAEQFETAQLMPVAVRGRFSGELVCYARSVVHQEWPQMESGNLGDGYNPWGVTMFATLKTTEPRSASEQAAYGKWLDQRTDREDARADRTHGAEGVIPDPLWIVLFVSAAIIFVYMLFFADSGERAVVQGLLMGSVVSVIVTLLLLLQALNNPFHSGVGGLNPIAMSRSLRLVDQVLPKLDAKVRIPCNREGVRTRT
jgi:hypothetical protein